MANRLNRLTGKPANQQLALRCELIGSGEILVFELIIDKAINEPGVVVTSSEKKSERQFFTGLRDPLAADPATLLQEAGLSAGDVSFKWEPYYSTHPEFANQRIRAILKPPDSVSPTFKANYFSIFLNQFFRLEPIINIEDGAPQAGKMHF